MVEARGVTRSLRPQSGPYPQGDAQPQHRKRRGFIVRVLLCLCAERKRHTEDVVGEVEHVVAEVAQEAITAIEVYLSTTPASAGVMNGGTSAAAGHGGQDG